MRIDFQQATITIEEEEEGRSYEVMVHDGLIEVTMWVCGMPVGSQSMGLKEFIETDPCLRRRIEQMETPQPPPVETIAYDSGTWRTT